MRRLAIAVLFLGASLCAFAANRPRVEKITVERLEQILATAHNQPDLQLAAKLKGMELTERLSTSDLVRLQRELPGQESQAALVALGDSSAFLRPPAAELPADPALSTNEQKNLLALAADYVQKTIARLPNFLAIRQSALFAGKPAFHSNVTFDPGEPLHYVSTATANVFYRNGHEKIDTDTADSAQPVNGKSKSKKQSSDKSEGDLASSGQFGPVLAKVLSDAAQGKLEWAYWQKAEDGDLAVFRYSVPRKSSHYNVQISLPAFAGFAADPVKEQPGYHGEIAIDPTDGTVMRLTILADLSPSSPMARADLSVEYASVEIGGQSYICPQRSVVLVQAYPPTAPGYSGGGSAEEHFANANNNSEKASRDRSDSPPQTLLTDVVFRDYHLFRSEAHIIAGSTSVSNSNSP